MSAYARVLTANELGVDKLCHAERVQLWPIEVAFKSSSSILLASRLSAEITFARDNHPQDEDALHLEDDEEKEDEEQDVNNDNSNNNNNTRSLEIQLERSTAQHALWSAFVSVPVGKLMYAINLRENDNDEDSGNSTTTTKKKKKTVAVGSLFVAPPPKVSDAATTRQIRRLQFYRVVSNTASGYAAVHFIFHRVHGVDCGAVFVNFRGESTRMKSHDTTTTTNDYISPIFLVPYDTPLDYSFRLNLRTATVQPRDAPITRLGWDPSKSHSGALVTWNNSIRLQRYNYTPPFPLLPALLLAAVAVTIRKAFRHHLRRPHSGDVD